jgi:magnesium-transporting ATPase (P-type)
MDNQNYPNQQQPQYQQQPYQQQPYQQQPYQPSYGYQQPNQQRPMKPDNYLVWAILTTLLCCLPFGIVSIVYSSKVDSLYNAGDYMGAQNAANNAKKWAMWSAIIGGVMTVIVIILYVIIIAGAVAEGAY